MDHFAGLDVSVKETSVCIVDDTGKIVREVKVASEPEALLAVLKNPAYHFKRIGLEAGPLSQWLFSALAEAELPVVCVETRHMQAVLKAQINKTDRNDARGIAQMMRVGLYRPVHVKTLRSQKLRMLLTHRKLLQSKAIAIENDLRGTLRNFGLKVGMVGKVKFEARIKELSRTSPIWPSGAAASGHQELSRRGAWSFGKARLAQALNEADAVFRPPERRRHPVKIAKPQRGIDLAQPGHRRPRFDDPIRKSIGHRRHPQCRSPVRLLVEGLGRPGYCLVVTTGEGVREGHAGISKVSRADRAGSTA